MVLAATLRILITVTLSLALSPRGRGDYAALRVDYALDSRLRGNDGGGKGRLLTQRQDNLHDVAFQ